MLRVLFSLISLAIPGASLRELVRDSNARMAAQEFYQPHVVWRVARSTRSPDRHDISSARMCTARIVRHGMLRRAIRESSSTAKGHLWGGESRARSSDLEPTDNPDPAARPGSSATGPALRQTEARPTMPSSSQHASDPGAPYAAPGPASAAHQGRAGHPAPLPALGGRPLARRQGALALSGRRCRHLSSPAAWPKWPAARSPTGRSCPRKGPADLIGLIEPVARRRR